MILFDFEHESPSSTEAAVARLNEVGEEARFLAGGTDMIPNMRIGIVKPECLISLTSIPYAPPALDAKGWLEIDALTRLSEIEHSKLVGDAAPMLAASAHSVAGNQIRQVATLGGNLCQETRCLYLNQKHDFQFVEPCFKRGGDCCYPFPKNKKNVCWSVYMSDIAPVLVALNAEVSVLGAGGEVRLPIAALFTGDGLRPHTLNPGELIRRIHIPPAPSHFGWGYHKSTVRGGLEFATALMAVALEVRANGLVCSDARIAIGAVNEGPVRLDKTEASMKGLELNPANLRMLADQASQEVNPLPHHGFSKPYLRDNIRVHLKRTLALAVERAGTRMKEDRS
ncbi:MAG: FAD binding domain-containing protein [Alphaproteobacteria bacterium]|nr:FAD binding domain-containing protein [Alphaproteobacteria bacterium]